jgi:TATA-box binding protein (TBP) (component of TFIID and TFIIIB)
MEKYSGVTVLVYSSGKAAIAGIKNSSDVGEIVESLESILKSYA